MNNDFEIIRSARRTRLAFRFRPSDGVLEVLAPLNLQEKRITAAIRKNKDALEKLHQKVRKKMQDIPVYKFEEGEFFLYRGSWYPLKFSRRVLAFDNAFLLPPGNEDEIKRSLEKLYRKLAAACLPDKVREKAAACGLTIRDIRINGAVGRWGSCSSSGNINLSWRLILCPDEIIDYVICHELAHRLELNHSDAFWQEVAKLCPDYQERENFLRENEHRYRLW